MTPNAYLIIYVGYIEFIFDYLCQMPWMYIWLFMSDTLNVYLIIYVRYIEWILDYFC